MNVGSLELSRELYEVSGWKDVGKVYNFGIPGKSSISTFPHTKDNWCPAYDLGYLLRKLPAKRIKLRNNSQEGWGCQYDPQRNRNTELTFYADNPEDATIKLCIELFEQGIIV